jgi:hypothetical protein
MYCCKMPYQDVRSFGELMTGVVRQVLVPYSCLYAHTWVVRLTIVVCIKECWPNFWDCVGFKAEDTTTLSWQSGEDHEEVLGCKS